MRARQLRKQRERARGRNSQFGFSMVELATTMVVLLIVAAIGLPAIIRTKNSYLFNTTVRGVSDAIQRPRYEAIKRNTNVSCYYSVVNGQPRVWVDLNRTGVFAPPDPAVLYPTVVNNAVPGGYVPGPASTGFAAAAQPPGIAGGGGVIATFDSRGAVSFVGAPAIWILYFTLNNDRSYGAKAITIEPMGRSKTWNAEASGAWHSP